MVPELWSGRRSVLLLGAGVVRLLAKIALRCLAREAHPLGERASTNETTLLCAASPLLSGVRLSKRRIRSPAPRLQVQDQPPRLSKRSQTLRGRARCCSGGKPAGSLTDARSAAYIAHDRLRTGLDLELLNSDQLSVAPLELVVSFERTVERALQTGRCGCEPERASFRAAAVDPT